MTPYAVDFSKPNSTVAAKSRCVTGIGHIAFIINGLHWLRQRDLNPRPSAPKTGQAAYGNLLNLSELKCF